MAGPWPEAAGRQNASRRTAVSVLSWAGERTGRVGRADGLLGGPAEAGGLQGRWQAKADGLLGGLAKASGLRSRRQSKADGLLGRPAEAGGLRCLTQLPFFLWCDILRLFVFWTRWASGA